MSSDDDRALENNGDWTCASGGNWDSDDDMNFVPPKRPSQDDEDGFVYEVISVDQIVQLQKNIVDDLKSVLSLSPEVTRTLLNHFKWDKDRLVEKYFESSPQEFFQRAQVRNPFERGSAIVPEAANTSPNNTVCEICYSPSEELKSLGCDHKYCVVCWKQFLANKTYSEGLSHTITCPAFTCDILVDYAAFPALADDPEVVERYKQLISNTFVECNTLMRWCPAPDCTQAIMVNYKEPKAVECKCGHKFCFGCAENLHEPVSCGWLKKWLKNYVEESETSNWLALYTKDCPQCQVTIEKNGGCNHIICTTCRYDFCWLCLGPWHPQGASWAQCQRFDEEGAYKGQLAYSPQKTRHGHYYNRYSEHMQSMRMERKLYDNVQTQMDNMQAEASWIEIQFLRDAVDALCQCRSTLMYSYVFAFYVVNNNQKAIFEINQRDLEMATEKMSECLEREITAQNLHDIKVKVLNLTRYCLHRRHVLVSHVQEGNEKDWWGFKSY